MTAKQFSAEKDLLKLIENPGLVEAKKAEMAAKKAPGKKNLFSFFKRAKSSLPETKAKPTARSFFTDRKNILIGLFIATVCFAVYFFFTLIHEYSKVTETKGKVQFTYISEGKDSADSQVVAAQGGAPAQASSAAAPSLPSLPSVPADGIRNVFKPASTKKEDLKKENTYVPEVGDYRLVGISKASQDADTYAMIKNAKTNITFFLKAGEKLDAMEVVRILENNIVVKVKDKEVELR